MLQGCLWLMAHSLYAQHTLELRVQLHPGAACDSFYLAGSMNSWNPADSRYRLYAKNGTAHIRLENLPPGSYEWKFTRGSWQQVETAAGGGDISNRRIQLSGDTLLDCVIENWKPGDARPRPSTASPGVKLADSAFYFPQLHRYRRIWIYLPPGYAYSRKRYPVLYMQDGQNLFDEALAPYGEWGVDEALDSLIGAGMPAAIVVGIENGHLDRMSEYNAWKFVWMQDSSPVEIEPAADRYLHDLVYQLKPFIDRHYRTLKTSSQTWIAGSSMGGLLSCYAALRYPEVFGKAGVFSPAFWTASGMESFADSAAARQPGKFFFYMGGREGEQHLRLMNRIAERIGAQAGSMIYMVMDPEGEHQEAAWRKWFPEFYRWMMADGFNVITRD